MTKLQQASPSPATQTRVPLSVPEIRGNEWTYLKECLDTNWVSSVGPFVERFERTLAEFTGRRYAVATTTGTTALHIALLVAGVEPDDEVITSSLTFVAPANAIRYVGAWPVFLDAEAAYWQMDPERLKRFLEQECRWQDRVLRNRASGRRIRALLPVDILGHPCDLDALLELARRYELTVIEDATESLGATYKDRPVGRLGDVACFSFNGNKIVTTGGGGMLVTDHAAWAERAKHLTTQAKQDGLEYIHDEVGYNYRLTNLQAAVGCAQMERLPQHVAAKRRLAQTYGEALAAVPGLAPMREAPWARSIFWLYTILIDAQAFGLDSRQLCRQLQARQIESRPLWQPLHCSPAHGRAGQAACPVAESIWRRALSLPCSVGLTPADQAHVIDAIKDLMGSVS
jgi:perosamine synthetase